MSEKTGLERQESEVEAILGKPSGINGTDKSMLEMTDTNRLVYDSLQSELGIAVKMLHSALVATDNRKKTIRWIRDSQTGKRKPETVIVDNWKWLKDIDYFVQTNQLTIRGYSRSQHLRQTANIAAISYEEPEPSFWSKLFGGK